MADAFRLHVGHRESAEYSVASLCRIAWHGEAAEWQLRNGSFTLMCARNGKRVRGGSVVPVRAGDTLELGLRRFVLEPGDDGKVEQESAAEPDEIPFNRPEPEAQPAPASEAEPAPDATPETQDLGLALPETFDLRSLDDRHDEGQRTDSLVDPFGVLDIAGARARPAADTLAELLGERPQPDVRSTPPAGPPLGAGPAALLNELHEEFVRVVQDPDQLSGRTDWEGFAAFGAEAAPTLDELSRQAQTYPLLRDILQPREGVDQILEGFEPLARSGLLDEAHPPDVLGLFAPELARQARVPLPSLTRREHHELSADSHVRIGSMRTGKGEGAS